MPTWLIVLIVIWGPVALLMAMTLGAAIHRADLRERAERRERAARWLAGLRPWGALVGLILAGLSCPVLSIATGGAA